MHKWTTFQPQRFIMENIMYVGLACVKNVFLKCIRQDFVEEHFAARPF